MTFRHRRSRRSKLKVMTYVYFLMFVLSIYFAWDDMIAPLFQPIMKSAAVSAAKSRCNGNARCMSMAEGMVERKMGRK